MHEHTRTTALVTGGSGYIGAAICRQLAQDGHHVLIHANNNLDRANEIVEEIIQDNNSAEAFSLDLTNHALSQQVMDKIASQHKVQIIVHNAGVHDDVPFAGMSYDSWQKPLQVTLDGFYNAVHPLLMPMLRTRWGRIILVSSISGIIGNRGQANYAASKGALLPLAKTISQEYGSRGITCNVVAPGLIETPDTISLPHYKQMIDHTALKRAGKPAEVANTISFLTSDNASYISGQMITIDGGMT